MISRLEVTARKNQPSSYRFTHAILNWTSQIPSENSQDVINSQFFIKYQSSKHKLYITAPSICSQCRPTIRTQTFCLTNLSKLNKTQYQKLIPYIWSPTNTEYCEKHNICDLSISNIRCQKSSLYYLSILRPIILAIRQAFGPDIDQLQYNQYQILKSS